MDIYGSFARSRIRRFLQRSKDTSYLRLLRPVPGLPAQATPASDRYPPERLPSDATVASLTNARALEMLSHDFDAAFLPLRGKRTDKRAPPDPADAICDSASRFECLREATHDRRLS